MCVSDGGDVSDRLVIHNRCEPPLEGRYVHVKLVGDNLQLDLCEVEVYGTYKVREEMSSKTAKSESVVTTELSTTETLSTTNENPKTKFETTIGPRTIEEVTTREGVTTTARPTTAEGTSTTSVTTGGSTSAN